MTAEARAIRNSAAAPAAELYGAERSAVLNQAGFDAAFAEISSWPGYAPTPLVALPGLARALGVGAMHYKDERGRFGLRSFKALGGAYAVANVLRKKVAAATGKPGMGFVLAGGEDHALAATFPPGAPLPVGWRRVGAVREGQGILVDGAHFDGSLGWDHFA